MTGTLVNGLFLCPGCGRDEFESVWSGYEANFMCTSCGRCWHLELGWLRPVNPHSCAGCQHRDACVATTQPATTQPATTGRAGSSEPPVIDIDASQFDAVVFDMDGVITDTATVHAESWKRMFDAYLAHWEARTGRHQSPFEKDDYLQYVDGKHRDDGVASFLRSRGITLPLGSPRDAPGWSTVWALANRKNADFQRVLAERGVQAFPSSVDFVRDCQRHLLGTAIISASRNCQEVLEAAGIGDLFPVRVDGIETERLSLPGKPSPDVFVEAARRLGATPARAVIVEDAIAGVQAGRAGHFGLVVGVDRAGQAADLLAHGADVVVPDLAQLRVAGPRSASS